jgi:spore coat polysaccharide biosynthesis protein SpsF
MEALNAVPCDLRILACPEDCEKSFKPLADREGFALHTGSKEDVLARFCSALRDSRIMPDLDRTEPGRQCMVIRATGDNPFVFADAARAILGEALALGSGYAAYAGLPPGAGVEAVYASALFTAEREAREQPEREHVCPYLYGHPGRFLLHRPLAPGKWRGEEMRLTVDTGEDYQRAARLYEALDETLNKALGENRYDGEAIIAAYKKCFGAGA